MQSSAEQKWILRSALDCWSPRVTKWRWMTLAMELWWMRLCCILPLVCHQLHHSGVSGLCLAGPRWTRGLYCVAIISKPYLLLKNTFQKATFSLLWTGSVWCCRKTRIMLLAILVLLTRWAFSDILYSPHIVLILPSIPRQQNRQKHSQIANFRDMMDMSVLQGTEIHI